MPYYQQYAGNKHFIWQSNKYGLQLTENQIILLHYRSNLASTIIITNPKIVFQAMQALSYMDSEF